MGRVVILMGSKSDMEQAQKVASQLDTLRVLYKMRVASAHKSVAHLLAIIKEVQSATEPVVIITIAGRSNALSGMVDANLTCPVIACPPQSTAFGGADIFSSLRMPSGVAPMVVLEPENAALAAAKILALSDDTLREGVRHYQQQMTDAVIAADQSLT
jgi:5-(carboxyamino)imidazole ribonucleotide mutase